MQSIAIEKNLNFGVRRPAVALLQRAKTELTGVRPTRIEQVRKGSLPPLFSRLFRSKKSGGKPPLLTCSLIDVFHSPKWLLILFALLTSCSHHYEGPRAYVSNEKDGTITVIDIRSDRAISTINVGARPRGIEPGPDGKTIWVALSYPTNSSKGEDKIAVIDIASEKVIAKYDAGTDPEEFIVSDDRLYIANEDAGTASITNLKTNQIVASLPVGMEPEGVAKSPDGKWVYVTSESSSTVSVIDTKTSQVKKTFLVGPRPREAAFTKDGGRAYVSAENGYNISVVDTKNHDVVATINLPRGEATAPIKPKGLAIAPDDTTVYVSTGRGNSVAVIDAATETLKTLIPVGQRPWGIALSTDGKKLYTANGLSNDVSVIDVNTNKVVQTIKAGAGPWGIAIVP